MKEKFIKVYNVFFDSRKGSNAYNISSEELYVFLALSKQESFLYEENRISYEFLMMDMNRKNTKANRDKAIENIKSLSEKDIIQLIKINDTYATIKFNNLHEYEEIKFDNTQYIKGFERMFIDELDELMKKTKYNANLIYLYIMIKAKQTDKRDVELAYKILADIMNVSARTVQNSIKKLVELEFITFVSEKVTAEYNEINAYRAIESVVELKRTKELENLPEHYLTGEALENELEMQEAYLYLVNKGIISFEERKESIKFKQQKPSVNQPKEKKKLTPEQAVAAIFG
ncbi:MAG TPA: hypothetical protein DEB42_00475 [Jeotgalicoccus sp.]|nr:hypothetical protein [Jeotgalicoccus sp.]